MTLMSSTQCGTICTKQKPWKSVRYKNQEQNHSLDPHSEMASKCSLSIKSVPTYLLYKKWLVIKIDRWVFTTKNGWKRSVWRNVRMWSSTGWTRLKWKKNTSTFGAREKSGTPRSDKLRKRLSKRNYSYFLQKFKGGYFHKQLAVFTNKWLYFYQF